MSRRQTASSSHQVRQISDQCSQAWTHRQTASVTTVYSSIFVTACIMYTKSHGTSDIWTSMEDEDANSRAEVCESFNGIISELLTSVHMDLLHQHSTTMSLHTDN